MKSTISNQYPQKRSENLLIQQTGQETLIYNEQIHKAYCLNPVASAIWAACDGTRSTEQIAQAATFALNLPVDENAVLLALEDFRVDNLLEATEAMIVPPGLSRREMAMKLGFGAAMLLPVVATIVAPKAAQAYGTGGVDDEN